MPSAHVVRTASSDSSRAAATVAPKTPHTPVAWKPRRWNSPSAAAPRRATASQPATYAVTSSRPLAPVARATASAAGATTVVMWQIDPGWVSSKSSACMSVPLARAAPLAGTRARAPMRSASAVPPAASTTARASTPSPRAEAA